MTGYGPVDSGSNPDRRIDILPQVQILLCPLCFYSVLKDISLEENSDKGLEEGAEPYFMERCDTEVRYKRMGT